MIKTIEIVNSQYGGVEVLLLEPPVGSPYYKIVAPGVAFEVHEGMFLDHHLTWHDNVRLRIAKELLKTCR